MKILPARTPLWRDPLFIWPLIALVAALSIIHVGRFDIGIADAIYRLEGGQWYFRHKWLTSVVLHKYAQRFSILIGVITLGIAIASHFSNRLAPFRRGLWMAFSSAIAALLLVSLSKHNLPIACPWNLQRYGGDYAGITPLHFYWGSDVSGCFPAGHAAAGYCLLAWFFFARYYRFANYGYAVLPGLLLGLLYSTTQEMRGAHFLSHDVVSIALCWFVPYLGFRYLMPGEHSASSESSVAG
jgi:membrane-associated PAP2 superfamily phosphatase